MKKMHLHTRFYIVCLLIIFFIPFITNTTAKPTDLVGIQTSYPAATNFIPNVPYHCANPLDESNVTQVLAIASGTPNDEIQFNTTSLVTNKGSCVKLVMVNLSPDVTHSFVIDEVGGGNPTVVDENMSGPNIDQVNMDISNSTVNYGFGPGINVFYFKTPNVDTQFTYYCEQPGHEAAGMKGTLYVGSVPQTNNNGSVGILFVIVIGLIVVFVVIMQFIKKKSSGEKNYNELKNINSQFLSTRIQKEENFFSGKQFCYKCGSVMEKNDVFCQNCGTRVS